MLPCTSIHNAVKILAKADEQMSRWTAAREQSLRGTMTIPKCCDKAIQQVITPHLQMQEIRLNSLQV